MVRLRSGTSTVLTGSLCKHDLWRVDWRIKGYRPENRDWTGFSDQFAQYERALAFVRTLMRCIKANTGAKFRQKSSLLWEGSSGRIWISVPVYLDVPLQEYSDSNE